MESLGKGSLLYQTHRQLDVRGRFRLASNLDCVPWMISNLDGDLQDLNRATLPGLKYSADRQQTLHQR